MNDHSHIETVQRRLESARNAIHKLAPLVGMAKQVRDYDSDRRKNLVAKYAQSSIIAGKSVAASELDARANAAFHAEFDALAGQRSAAEKTIAEWDAAFATYEAARSLLSMAKETMRTLE